MTSAEPDDDKPAVAPSPHAPLVAPATADSAAAEYTAARAAAALFDLSARDHLDIAGRDRAAFLHNFCTNDIKQLAAGEGCEAFVTNIKGRILGHILVMADESTLGIDSGPGSAGFLRSHLDRYLITEEAGLSDRSAELGDLFLAGPGAAAILEREFGQDVDRLAAYQHCRVESVHAAARVARIPFVLPPGFLITAPRPALDELRAALLARGAVAARQAVFEVLRIEAGFPWFGTDITDEHLVQEAQRTQRAVSFIKGCYLGQEPIARLDALGHANRGLCVLQLDEQPAYPEAAVFDAAGGQQIGKVSSLAVRPTDGVPVALAMLRAARAKPGTRVSLRSEGAPPITATVIALPA